MPPVLAQGICGPRQQLAGTVSADKIRVKLLGGVGLRKKLLSVQADRSREMPHAGTVLYSPFFGPLFYIVLAHMGHLVQCAYFH